MMAKRRVNIDRKLVPFRMWPDELVRLKEKMKEDNTSFQFLMYGFVQEYLKDNPETRRIVRRYSKGEAVEKSQQALTELDSERLFRTLAEFNPLEGDE